MTIHRATSSGQVRITDEDGVLIDSILVRVGRAYDDEDPRQALAIKQAPVLFGLEDGTETASAGKRSTRVPKKAAAKKAAAKKAPDADGDTETAGGGDEAPDADGDTETAGGGDDA